MPAVEPRAVGVHAASGDALRHLFLAIHHPRLEHADELIDAMGRFGKALEEVPGMLHASAWRDHERIIAISIWESRGAFAAAGPTLGAALAGVPFDDWEERPRELFGLDEIETIARS